MGAIDHDGHLLTLLGQDLLGFHNVFLFVVRPLAASAQNHKAVLIALGPGDSRQSLLRNTHEMVPRGGRANSVDRNTQVSIRSILEAHGEGQTTCQLPVQLGLGGSCADGAHGNEVSEELRRDCVQHLARDGHAPGGQIREHLARDVEALVDLVRLVHVRVVDQALPAHGSAGLLEVGSHDDAQVTGKLLREGLQAVRILESCRGVVDGTGTNDNEKAVVLAHNDLCGIAAALEDGLKRVLGDGNLLDEESGLDQGVLALD